MTILKDVPFRLMLNTQKKQNRRIKDMNGYKILLESYKEMLNNPNIANKDSIHAEIKALEPFVDRTEEEINRMFDSGAFNQILKAYCKEAMMNCGLNRDIISKVISDIEYLLDTKRANEILKF